MRIIENVKVQTPHGLNLWAASQLASLSRTFQSRITVQNVHVKADVDSILGLLSLEARQGSKVRVTVDGEDAYQALGAVADFFQKHETSLLIH